MAFRPRLGIATTALVGACAAGVVALEQKHEHEQLDVEVEHALTAKCDALAALLCSSCETLDLAGALTAEATVGGLPLHCFCRIVDASGRVLADGGPTEVAARDDMRVRSVQLPQRVELDGRRGLTVEVAAPAAPIERALRAHLLQALVYASSAVAFVAGAQRLAVGRTLRRVAAVSRSAARIHAEQSDERVAPENDAHELTELCTTIDGMLESLARSRREMEDFTSDAAHQIRTPLTRLCAELELLLRCARHLSMGERTQLEAMRDELDRLTRTCSRLLLLARLDHRASEHELLGDQIDLADLVAELADQITPMARDKGVRVTCHPAPACTLVGSRELIVEALLNLLHNAVRFTKAGGVVDLHVERAHDGVEVIVSDTGPGVPEELRELVFRRFFRARVADVASEEGAGLGLAIVRAIARAHGGDVRVEPVAPHGARFRVRVPLRGDSGFTKLSSTTHETLSERA